MLVNIALYICSFLQEKIIIAWNGLRSILLSLCDEFSTTLAISRVASDDLKCFRVVHANIAFWAPLALVLIETIEIACGVVEEDTLRREIFEDFRLFKLWYRF